MALTEAVFNSLNSTSALWQRMSSRLCDEWKVYDSSFSKIWSTDRVERFNHFTTELSQMVLNCKW